MPSFKVLAKLLRNAALADAAPGFVDSGIAPGLHALETADHTSNPGTSNSIEFDRRQQELTLKKKRKRRKEQNGL